MNERASFLNSEKVEHGLTVFLQIKLQVHDYQNYQSIALLAEEVNRLDEIMAYYHITGESNYLLKVLVKDMKAFEEFIVNNQNTGHCQHDQLYYDVNHQAINSD